MSDISTLENPLSQIGLQRIRSKLKMRSGVDITEFDRRLQITVYWYKAQRNLHKKERLTSDKRIRKIASLHSSVHQLQLALQTLPTQIKESLRGAAEALAGRHGMPGYEPETVRIPSDNPDFPLGDIHLWPVDEADERFRAELAWLKRCLLEASHRERGEQRGKGNRADVNIHDLICALWQIYSEYAESPERPFLNGKTQLPEGEGFHFLAEALAQIPVSIGKGGKSPVAILKRFQRAAPRP